MHHLKTLLIENVILESEFAQAIIDYVSNDDFRVASSDIHATFFDIDELTIVTSDSWNEAVLMHMNSLADYYVTDDIDLKIDEQIENYRSATFNAILKMFEDDYYTTSDIDTKISSFLYDYEIDNQIALETAIYVTDGILNNYITEDEISANVEEMDIGILIVTKNIFAKMISPTVTDNLDIELRITADYLIGDASSMNTVLASQIVDTIDINNVSTVNAENIAGNSVGVLQLSK